MKNSATFLAIGAMGIGAMAQSLPTDTLKLHEVEVFATPKAPVELLPLSVSIIGSDLIEESAETNILPVLANHVPGLFVTERGIMGYGVSGGAAGSVNIRGESMMTQ